MLEPSNLYALAFSWTTLDQDLLLKAFIIIQIMYTFINPNLYISSFLHQTKIFCNRLYTACMFMPRFHVLISSCFVHNGCPPLGRHVRVEWKIRHLKDVCFRPLNSCISTRKKAKNFQQYLKFNTKHVSRT